MIDFAPPLPREPNRFRIAYALREMRERLGSSTSPTQELCEELARKYEITPEELGKAWIRSRRA